jgi:hypothetical protein
VLLESSEPPPVALATFREAAVARGFAFDPAGASEGALRFQQAGAVGTIAATSTGAGSHMLLVVHEASD